MDIDAFVCFLFDFKAMVAVGYCMSFVDRTPTFRADRPFMYFILDSENATQIFAGTFKQHENWKPKMFALIQQLFYRFIKLTKQKI